MHTTTLRALQYIQTKSLTMLLNDSAENKKLPHGHYTKINYNNPGKKEK